MSAEDANIISYHKLMPWLLVNCPLGIRTMHWLDLDGAMKVVGQVSTGGGVDVLWYADQIRSGSGQAGHVFVGLLVSMTHKASVPTWPPLARACWPCVNRCVFPIFFSKKTTTPFVDCGVAAMLFNSVQQRTVRVVRCSSYEIKLCFLFRGCREVNKSNSWFSIWFFLCAVAEELCLKTPFPFRGTDAAHGMPWRPTAKASPNFGSSEFF
jgi:hypothetical protein